MALSSLASGKGIVPLGFAMSFAVSRAQGRGCCGRQSGSGG